MQAMCMHENENLRSFKLISTIFFILMHIMENFSIACYKPDCWKFNSLLNDYPFTSKANNEIRYLENVIKQIENISSFDANFVLIATWNRVKPRSFIFDRTRVSTLIKTQKYQ